VTLRKTAALLAAFGIMVGLIGSGVGAQFTDQVIAQENINVGSFGCQFTNANGDLLGKSITYNAPDIMSSAPSSAPFTMMVKNTGSIPAWFHVTDGGVLGTNNGPFSGIPVGPINPVGPIAGGGVATFNAGLQWSELSSDQLTQSYSIIYTVACSDNGPQVILDNTPALLPSNLESDGPEAYGFNEWGPGVQFDGTARKLATATVTMSSFACESGSWDGVPSPCVSTPGHTYAVPITFNVYNVGTGGVVGSLITTKTQVFAIPFRPSGDPIHCPADPSYYAPHAVKWWDGTKCNNGQAVNITFTFSGQMLPNTAILGVTFNTRDFGYAPTGVAGPTDALNIGMYPSSGVVTAPSVGHWLPDGSHTYLSVGPAGGPQTPFIGSAPVTSNPGGDNFVGKMPAIQITATSF
jgi:hypothetical protein